MNERRHWIVRILPLLAVAALVFAMITQSRGPSSVLRIGSPAPALAGVLPDGTAFDLGDQKGKVVVVNFWTSWCPPCRAEAPMLSALHRRLLKEDGLVLGVSVEGLSNEKVAEAAREIGMEFPVLAASDDLLDRYPVEVLPTTYVIGRDGRVERALIGGLSERELDAAVKAATEKR